MIELRPTLVQLSLMAYKPWVAKYQIKMLEDGPLPDFFIIFAFTDPVKGP